MNRLSILLVEDHEACRWTALRILMEHGHEVTTCSNGYEALVLCHEQGLCFDAIVLNTKMPVMDGHETTLRIRSDLRSKDVPIINVTAGGDVQGVDATLLKPYRKKELIEAVAKAVEKRKTYFLEG